MDIWNEAKRLEPYVVDLRRDLHEHPETSMKEERTVGVVLRELEAIGIPFEVIPYGGVIGFLEGEKPGKTVILRADLDALPMKEAPVNLKKEKVVVAKTDEAAHMCGHDGHTAMLIGAAKILARNKNKLAGRILFSFEQGEEDGKGIYRLLKRLVEIGADGVWGIHIKNDLASGKMSVDSGPRMAAAFPFDVELKGNGGHGSRPDLAISPIDCFVDFYQQFQVVRLRNLDPFRPITYSIGKLIADSSANVIPDTVRFNGTARYLHKEQGENLVHEFKSLLDHVCAVNGCTYEYIQEPTALDLLVYNEETCSEIARKAIEKSAGAETVTNHPAWMASEPFALYQKYFPGVFAFLGTKNEEKGTGAEHHNAHFDIDEDILKIGVAATARYALDFLEAAPEIDYDRETQSVEDLFREMNFPIYKPEEEN